MTVKSTRRASKPASALAGGLAVFVGGMVLVGWALDVAALKSILPGLVTVKPNTALAFILAGIALLFSSRPPATLSPRASAFVSSLAQLCALLAGVIGLLTLGEYAFGWNPGFDQWLFPEPAGAVATLQPGRMAPDTALCFVLLAAGLGIVRRSRKTTGTFVASAILGSLVTTVALASILAYFSPALRTQGWWGLTMMAAPTAALFAALGAALALIAWQESRSESASPAKPVEGSGSRAGLAFLVVFLVLAAAIVSTGMFYYRNYERHYRAEVEHQLSAIAELKVSQIVQWRKERLEDGSVFFQNSAISAPMRRLLEKPEDADAQRQLQVWIAKYQQHYDYDQVRLLDARGVTRLSSPAGVPAISTSVARDVSDVLRSRQMMFQDFYRNNYDKKIYLGILVPILDEQDASQPLGVLALRVDPESYLYPSITRWPTPSLTAETLLVRRDGNDALFLNELRFQTNTALNLRVPLDRTTMPAVQAALGREGVMEGIDYRGVPAVAALRIIPDSPWALVARMDTAEVYGPMRRQLWQMVVLTGALLLGAGACVGLVWRQQRVRFYREEAAGAETLRETRDYLENLINHANAPIIVWDTQFKITRFNHAFETLTGRPAGEVIGKSLEILLPPSLVESLMGLIKKPLEGERWETVEIPILHLDGSVRTVLWNSATIFAADGKIPVAAIAQGQDITARKQAEEELRASEERFRIASETANDVVYEWDLKQSVQWVGKIDEMLGYEPAAFPRTLDGWAASVHPEDLERTMAEIQAHLEGRAPYDAEYRVRRKDGVYRWWSARGAAARTPDGKPVRWIGSITDITERKQADEALRESESRFRQLAESLPQLVWTCQPDGPCDYFNRQWIEFTGVPEAQQFGFGWLEQLHPDDRAPTVAAWEAAVALGADFHVEFRIRRHDGEFRWFDTQAVRLRDAEGHTIKWFGSNTDITERKRTEEEVRTLNAELEQRVQDRTAQLEAANKELEAFSYSVSHDLRAPLRAIDGYGRILLEDHEARLDPEGRRVLGVISSETRRMGQLVDDLLAFSRLGRQNLESSGIDMTAMAQAVFEEQAAQAPTRVFQLVVKPLPTARGDRAMIRVVFGNLISNAIKFTAPRNPAVIEIGSRREDGQAVYYVKDNGVGFDMNYAHKLFGVFQRLHTAEEFEGTGVGLALIQRVIHRHGGRVWAEGNVNDGATFSFSLPDMKGAP